MSTVLALPDTEATLQTVSDEALARRIASAGSAEGRSAAARSEADAEEAELYRRFAPRVRLYGRRHLRDGAAADDLAQDVLLLTIERLRAGEVHKPHEIGSFILGTSRMMVHSERRVTQRRSLLAAQFMEADAAIAPSPAVTLDTPRLTACLRALDERDRMVVVLTFFADRDSAGIAADLGVTSGAVRVIRHRAMARLRDCVMGSARV